MNDLLDGKPIVVQRGEHWCCLLCLRQFESEAKVCKHLSKSALHTDNLSAALAEGRVQQPCQRCTRSRLPLPPGSGRGRGLPVRLLRC